MGGEFDGQIGLSHDFTAHEVGEWHLAGGDQVQRGVIGHRLTLLPALFCSKQVALKLGQLAGALEAVGIDDVGHIAFGVAMLQRLHVQHELGQRAVHARNRALHHGEARAGELDAHVKVQAQRRADIDVVFGLEVRRGGGLFVRTCASVSIHVTAKATARIPGAHHHVAVLIRADGHAGVWQVGHAQQHGLQVGLNLIEARFGRLLFDRKGTASLSRSRFRVHRNKTLPGRHIQCRTVTRRFIPAKSFCYCVALALQLFRAGLNGFTLSFQRLVSGHVQKCLGRLAGLKAANDRVQVFAEGGDV